jgi:hypothetical protein
MVVSSLNLPFDLSTTTTEVLPDLFFRLRTNIGTQVQKQGRFTQIWQNERIISLIINMLCFYLERRDEVRKNVLKVMSNFQGAVHQIQSQR